MGVGDVGMNLVSVVIPCFNAGRHIDEAVQSALAQTWRDLEVVIVDDGSTDAETLRILGEARWPRTRILHQGNGGPSAARNRAIREAAGRYILPLDADDTIEPTYVEKAIPILAGGPDVGCVYCKAMKFGAESGPWDLPPFRPEELAVDNVIFVTALFRKADWQAVGGFDERLRHGVEDYDFWVKLVASGKSVVQLDEFLFNYRVQEASRTTRFQDGIEWKIATYASIFRNNQAFYATHAEALFRHRFDLYAQIADWERRFAALQAGTNASDAKRQQEFDEALRDARKRAKALAVRCEALEAALAEHRRYWQGRYGGLDEFANQHPGLRRAAGLARRVFHPSQHRAATTTHEQCK